MSEQQTAVQETPETAAATTAQTPEGTPPVTAKDGDSKEPVTPPAEAAKADEVKPTPPEKYELKLPEGSQLDAGAIERISAFAKENGLSNEAAQAALDREHEAVHAFHEGQKQDLENKVKAWEAELSTDKEIGGDKFKENVELAHRVIDRFADEDFKQALKDTGFGNYPGLVKTFHKIGRAMAEDKLVIPGSQSGAGAVTHEAILYPEMQKS